MGNMRILTISSCWLLLLLSITPATPARNLRGQGRPSDPQEWALSASQHLVPGDGGSNDVRPLHVPPSIDINRRNIHSKNVDLSPKAGGDSQLLLEGPKIRTTVRELSKRETLPPSEIVLASLRMKRNTVSTLPLPEQRRRRSKRQKRRKKRKKKKKRPSLKRRGFKRRHGRHRNPVTAPKSLPTLTSITPLNMTSVNSLPMPVGAPNASVLKLMTKDDGRLLTSGHEMMVTISQGGQEMEKPSEDVPHTEEPHLVFDHEVSVSMKSEEREDDLVETTPGAADILLPHGVLSSRTLSWLPYNPNIRVSIQVVGDVASSSSSSSTSLSDITKTNNSDESTEDIVHQNHDIFLDQKSSYEPGVDGFPFGDLSSDDNELLTTEISLTKKIANEVTAVYGDNEEEVEQMKRRKKFILSGSSNGNSRRKTVGGNWNKQKSKGTLDKSLLESSRETLAKNALSKRRGQAYNKRKNDHLEGKKSSKKRDHKRHPKIEGGAAWELVSGLAAALEGLLESSLKSDVQDGADNQEKADDACALWATCRVERALQELADVTSLPSCPCFYPADLVYHDSLFDPIQNKTFRWLPINGRRERIDVYQRGAHLCLRSRVSPHRSPHSLASQICCYNRNRRLITRGSGAGTPELVSPQVSASLHRQVDILPWLACRGNFLRYHAVRPPNNDQHCFTVPEDHVYHQQVFMATDY